MLEIKGRSKSIALSDVRQLDQWVTDLTYEGGDDGQEEWKGVFLANAFIHVHPDDREPPFPANAIDYAEKRELALLTTSDLLNALVADQTGEHDPQAWWDDVIATSGLFGEPEAGSY